MKILKSCSRLTLLALAALLLAPAIAIAQDGGLPPFPNLGYKVEQWFYIIEGFNNSFGFFKMMAGRTEHKGLFYLALTAGLIGGLLLLVNPKFQKPLVVACWLIMVFVMLVGPYSSDGKARNPFFYSFNSNSFSLNWQPTMTRWFNQEIEANDATTDPNSAAEITTFFPQLLVIHLMSTIHTIIADALWDCHNGVCMRRDPVSTTLADSSFRTRPELRLPGKHQEVIYERFLYTFMGCGNVSDMYLMPYNEEIYNQLVPLYPEDSTQIPMVSAAQHAELVSRTFIVDDILEGIKAYYGGVDDGSAMFAGIGAFPPRILLSPSNELRAHDPASYDSGLHFIKGIHAGNLARNTYDPTRTYDADAILGDFIATSTLMGRSARRVHAGARWRHDVGHPSFLFGMLNSAGPLSYSYLGQAEHNNECRIDGGINGSKVETAHMMTLVGRDTCFDTEYEAFKNSFLRTPNPYDDSAPNDRSLVSLYVDDDQAGTLLQMPANMLIYRKTRPLFSIRPGTQAYFDAARNPRRLDRQRRILPMGSYAFDANYSPARSFAQNANLDSLLGGSVIRSCADLHASTFAFTVKEAMERIGEGAEQILDLNQGRLDISIFANDAPRSASFALARVYENQYQELFTTIRNQPAAAGMTADDIATLAKAMVLQSTNQIIIERAPASFMATNPGSVVEASGGANAAVAFSIDSDQMAVGNIGRGIGGLGNWIAERVLRIVAEFVGAAAVIFIMFLHIMLDMAIMIILLVTPLAFLMGLLIPSNAPGLLMLSVAIPLVLKAVPITLTIVNYVLGLVMEVLPGWHVGGGITEALLIFAAAGLYMGAVGLTMFLLFKIGDSGNLQQLTQLDNAAKQAADSMSKVAKVIAGAAVGGGVAGVAGVIGAVKGDMAEAKDKDEKFGFFDGVGSGVKGFLTQGTEPVTKAIAQIPGLGEYANQANPMNAYNEAYGRAPGLRKRELGQFFNPFDSLEGRAKRQQAYDAQTSRFRAARMTDEAYEMRLNDPNLDSQEELDTAKALMAHRGQKASGKGINAKGATGDLVLDNFDADSLTTSTARKMLGEIQNALNTEDPKERAAAVAAVKEKYKGTELEKTVDRVMEGLDSGDMKSQDAQRALQSAWVRSVNGMSKGAYEIGESIATGDGYVSDSVDENGRSWVGFKIKKKVWDNMSEAQRKTMLAMHGDQFRGYDENGNLIFETEDYEVTDERKRENPNGKADANLSKSHAGHPSGPVAKDRPKGGGAANEASVPKASGGTADQQAAADSGGGRKAGSGNNPDKTGATSDRVAPGSQGPRIDPAAKASSESQPDGSGTGGGGGGQGTGVGGGGTNRLEIDAGAASSQIREAITGGMHEAAEKFANELAGKVREATTEGVKDGNKELLTQAQNLERAMQDLSSAVKKQTNEGGGQGNQ